MGLWSEELMQDRPCMDVPIAWTAFGERVVRRNAPSYVGRPDDASRALVSPPQAVPGSDHGAVFRPWKALIV